MKISLSKALKYILAIVLISTYSMGAMLGIVLMSLSAWQYSGSAINPNFYVTIYGNDIRLVLALLLASGVLLIVTSVFGILTGVLFVFVQPRRGSQLLSLLAIGLMLCLTMEAIALTVQIEQWEEQVVDVPGLLETMTISSTLGPDDWFGDQLTWFQDRYGCCGYNNGNDFTNGPAAHYALSVATNQSVSNLPNVSLWRPRSCCDDFTVFPFECTESVASYNGRAKIPNEGCGVMWYEYLATNQWALVGVAKAAGIFQIVAAQIPVWLLLAQMYYSNKEDKIGGGE